jgi:hypothetical protein
MATASEKLIAGYGPLADFLTSEGFPVSPSTMTKYCSPKVDTGPPKEGVWKGRALFKPSRALEWARSRSGIGEHAI